MQVKPFVITGVECTWWLFGLFASGSVSAVGSQKCDLFSLADIFFTHIHIFLRINHPSLAPQSVEVSGSWRGQQLPFDGCLSSSVRRIGHSTAAPAA